MNYRIFISAVLLILQGCSTAKWQSVQLQDYLQPYIGQSADTIQNNLHLQTLGFQTLKQPKKTEKELTFTVLRPINIPIPMPQVLGVPGNMSGTGSSARLSSVGSSQQSYDVNFYCHIIFELDQQQIARAIRYEGKAC